MLDLHGYTVYFGSAAPLIVFNLKSYQSTTYEVNESLLRVIQ
jgi:hypothetical protein